MTQQQTIQLRPYQSEAADAIEADYNDGKRSVLVVQPTGCGKTILCADILRRRRHLGRSMMLAHRYELVQQAQKKIESITQMQCAVEMAEFRANETSIFSRAPVIVGTIQTQVAGSGRMNRFDPNEFATLIIDEAHHSTSDTYRQVVEYYRQNPDLLVLGVTATPDRADEEALLQIYESCPHEYTLIDAVHDGWLVTPKRKACPITDYDLSEVHTTAGDFNSRELSDILESDQMVLAMADKAAEVMDGRLSLVFAQSIEQSQLWRTALQERHGIRAIHIDGKTPKEDRKQLLEEYNRGEHQVLVNVGIATEGFDAPDIQCVVMARPTKSRSLYAQMLGRGTRPCDAISHLLGTCETGDERKAMIAGSSKPWMLVLDFVGNTGRHHVVHAADVLGGQYSDAVVNRAREIMDRTEEEITVEAACDEAEQELLKERREADEAERRKRARLKLRATYAESKIEDLFSVMGGLPPREAPWHKGRKPTPKQQKWLRSQNLWHEDLTFTEASSLIDRMIKRKQKGLCTPKMARKLSEFGYDSNLSFDEARRLLDRIAANGWKRPDPYPSDGDAGT